MEKVEIGDIFTLIDENDQEQEIEVLGTMNLEGIEYAAVGFVEEIQEESEEDIDVFFLRVEEDEQLSIIESDEEFDQVSAAFEEAGEAGEE
ncbi:MULTISPECIES: DUF1292 domain-containing protein [Bacillaceae]|uniref:Cyclopropane-fatty-acyl-phospholipid synthase n=1 Tax=Domibacillus aminovorans TaxID=29332 RepID=A0A177KYM8_9BACI|nr:MULTISPECIES: DUF1292 domain-containing protein [Bacillaceae]OAH58453.1 cyclopropane-fatty-acyl-phospholipid synthase [Domibacillus aminovorans]